MKTYYAGISILLVALNANAVSFDCKKASTAVEQMICGDSLLGKLDDALSQNYKRMLNANLFGNSRNDLISDQKIWNANRNKCTDKDCLVNSYQLRVDTVCRYGVIAGNSVSMGPHDFCVNSDSVMGAMKAQTNSGVVEYKPMESRVAEPPAQPPHATTSPRKTITTITGKVAAGGSDANGSITPDKGKRVTFLDDSPLADSIYEQCKVRDICEVSGEINNGHLTSITSVKLVKKDQPKQEVPQSYYEVKTFECKNAAADVLKIICGDRQLSTLDVRLSEAYDEHTKLFQNFNDVERTRLGDLLKQDHLNWYRDVLLKCKTAKCAEDAYTQRNDEMYKMAGRLEMQIQEVRQSKIAVGTKSSQPVVATTPVRPTTTKVNSYASQQVVKVMGITEPTLENVGAMTIQLISLRSGYMQLTADYCGLFNAHPAQRNIEMRFKDVTTGGIERLDTGGYCAKVWCKNSKQCMSRSRTDECFDLEGGQSQNHGPKLLAGIAFLSEQCAAMSR